MTGCLESINRSRGGVPKTSVLEALITSQGLDGDHQRDTYHHGGLNRAVVLFSLDLIQALRHEGHPIATGTTGENLTVSGIAWSSVRPGSELLIGDVQLVVTDYTAPCERIRRSFLDDDFTRVSQKLHPGWSRVNARVLVGGIVRPGDTIIHTRRDRNDG